MLIKWCILDIVSIILYNIITDINIFLFLIGVYPLADKICSDSSEEKLCHFEAVIAKKGIIQRYTSL